jgi:hypothetical protein
LGLNEIPSEKINTNNTNIRVRKKNIICWIILWVIGIYLESVADCREKQLYDGKRDNRLRYPTVGLVIVE